VYRVPNPRDSSGGVSACPSRPPIPILVSRPSRPSPYFEIHPVVSATLELPLVLPRCQSATVLSQSSPYGLAMHRSLSTPCRNWLPASARPLFAPFASTRLQGPPFSRPSRCQSATVLSSVLSVLSRLASSLSRLRLRRYSIPRYPRSPDSTRFSIFVSGPIIIHCIHILYPVSAFAAQPAPSSLHSCILCPYPPSSPRSCRLDLLLYRPRQGLLVDPRLFILRWPSQGCDHVSDAHGGCIVYPMFTILSSFEGFLAASPVPFAAS